MKRRKNSSQSSLEFFLDTVCNTFGGILLIAILVAVQIRQTEDIIEQSENPSPETIIELQEKIEQLTADIQLATTLHKNTTDYQTSSQNNNEKYLNTNYEQLKKIKNNSELKKTDLIRQLNKQKNENIQLDNQIKIIATNNQSVENEINDFTQQIQKQQSENLAKKQSNDNKQNEIANLSQQITQKENSPKQYIAETRKETIYLPKLHESKTVQSAYLILRFNRLYDASSRNDFESPGNEQLGTPKSDCGVAVDTTDKSKNSIQKILQPYNTKKVYITIIVYGDSADQFYIVRDILIKSGFEYSLKPSSDDSVWTFSGQSGSNQVQ
ncbi:MAG: hypothetical protein LBE18_02565 [Planctomycetaceae bacterium]|jgi:hypothetical protein|nr:hypothetical protein [Planctomycetaceae bacterium]